MDGFKKSMTGMFDSAKKGATTAAESTRVAAQKAQLMTEIKFLERKLTSRKEKFGVDVYESLANNEHAEVDRILAACKTELEEVKASIKAKQTELDMLRGDV
eukprot:CAMPEP_0198210584 /NCGR_PEP_ID=MMETSP1445-20131203/20845_1 /TAXON_ID=36898 /ORGANISM="Pyramimonas sp., Strain CCMP2087" /LENGTH=101 /DNA_ID=CAMNT_0043884681 /DNA_START=114 /DNA_END=419 /DNA_ORIENTATION=-